MTQIARRLKKKKDATLGNEIAIGLLNIQGLTNQKMLEIDLSMEGKLDILFLTETQLKSDRMNISKVLVKFDAMRNKKIRRELVSW